MENIQKPETKDIAIIGAGIIGLCSALYLQNRGHKVTIYDKSGVAQGASKGNAGHFATEQVFPLADKSLLPQLPKMLLDPLGPFRIRLPYLFKALPWFLRFMNNMRKSKFEKNKLALKALNSAALKAYQPLLDALEDKELVKLEGSLLVSESLDTSELKKVYRQFKDSGVAVEFLDKEQTLAHQPDLSDKVQAAILFTEVGHTVDPEILCQRLFSLFEQQGGAFVETNINAVKPNNNSPLILADNEKFSHQQVVIACGAWSKSLVNQLGYKVPLDTERGYHLNLAKHHKLSVPVASLERKFIMTPMAGGLRLAGTVEFAGLQAPANDARAHALLPHAKHLLAEDIKYQATECETWMGFRPSLPDSLPVICQAPKHPNLFFAFGHQHLGLTQGAITGQLISELIDGRNTEIDVKPYCISRFN